MTRRIATAIAAVALLTSPAVGLADDASYPLEKLVIDTASSAEQHKALAQYYSGRADEARAEARRHESMAKSYGAGSTSQKVQMRKHCDAIAKDYEAMAKEYDALAALHEKAAGGGM